MQRSIPFIHRNPSSRIDCKPSTPWCSSMNKDQSSCHQFLAVAKGVSLFPLFSQVVCYQMGGNQDCPLIPYPNVGNRISTWLCDDIVLHLDPIAVKKVYWCMSLAVRFWFPTTAPMTIARSECPVHSSPQFLISLFQSKVLSESK